MLVHRRVTPSSKFAGTHLYTWVERGTMRVKCLAQEHNAVPRSGLEPGPPDPESSALTIRPPRLPYLRICTQHEQTTKDRKIERREKRCTRYVERSTREGFRLVVHIIQPFGDRLLIFSVGVCLIITLEVYFLLCFLVFIFFLLFPWFYFVFCCGISLVSVRQDLTWRPFFHRLI